MLYFEIEDGMVVDVTCVHQRGERWITRNDMHTFDYAEAIALQAREITGKPYVAVDNPNSSPRFDVVLAPQVGDKISYSFNGDTYPDGVVTRVSTSLRVVRTDTGSIYYRRRKTASWMKSGRTWSLVRGHITERNPSF